MLKPKSQQRRLGEPANSPRWSIPILIAMGLVSLWALVDVGRSYPEYFYPRFWDEAVYVTDVMSAGVLWAPDEGKQHYAPAKLGYGVPLSAATSIFGARGAMYLSTSLWLLAIVVTGVAASRWFGPVAGAFATAFLAYSPMFGKYVAEAGPTTLAAFCFVLLWVFYQWRRPWLTGLAVGIVAFVDFKWAAPAGLAVASAELLIASHQRIPKRLVNIAAIGGTAIASLLVVGVLHPPYGEYLKNYILGHSGIIQFEPSGIFAYYLWLFGAAPCVIIAIVGMTWCRVRLHLIGMSPHAMRAFLTALLLCGVPLLFYSVMSTLKALRFYAVLFPLFSVVVAVGVSAAVAQVRKFLCLVQPAMARASGVVLAAGLAALIVIGSDGPAKHLRLPTGVPQALQALAGAEGQTGTISSYMWPVVAYGWKYPIQIPPFTMWGILSTDKWLLLDPMVDRVTIESSLMLQPVRNMTADSFWTMRSILTSHLNPILTAQSEFHSSDYFLSESTAFGISTLLRWQRLRGREAHVLTIYEIDLSRLPPAPNGR